MKRLLLAILLAGTFACAKAPLELSDKGLFVYKADRVVVAIGTLQHVAIELNGIKVCEPLPSNKCSPLLSNANTMVVVDAVADALPSIQQTPQGWKAFGAVTVGVIEHRLDEAGRKELTAYLAAVREILISF